MLFRISILIVNLALSRCLPGLCELHLQVGDELVRLELEVIYPAVANLKSIHVYIYNIYIYIYISIAHPVTELLLLPPEHLPWQVRTAGVIKRLQS